ncbi:MAG: hypothetical protein ACRCVI_01370 [Mycoplasmoidaceae bacterium]
MKNNKKSLIASLAFAATLVVLAIIGNLFCNWAIYLLIVAFVPTVFWMIKNRNKLVIKKNKKNVI